jgi:hypothetical protein
MTTTAGASTMDDVSQQDNEKKIQCLLDAAKQSYNQGSEVARSLCGDKLVLYDLSPTLKMWLNNDHRVIIVSIRGTDKTDLVDHKANLSLPLNRLSNTERYNRDKHQFTQWVRTHPPTQFDYYLTSHSLGGAVMSQFLRDFPFVKFSVAFNSAYQIKDLKQPTKAIHYYVDKDPLYLTLGRFLKNKRVIKFNEQKVSGFFDYVKNIMIPSNIQAHSLNQFDDSSA